MTDPHRPKPSGPPGRPEVCETPPAIDRPLGEDINAYNVEGMTRLHLAIEDDDIGLVRSLLENSADRYKRVAADLAPRDNAIELAARLNRTAILNILIGNDLSTSALMDRLEVAASWGSIEALGLLLQHHVPGKARDQAIVKTLETAAGLWLPDMVALLLRHLHGSANANDLNRALLAVCCDSQSTMDLYQPKPAWDWDRAVAVVWLLLEAGASVTGPFDSGVTPLHKAVRSSGVPERFIRLLIEAGADVKAADTLQMTPLLWALNKHQSVSEDTICELLRAGAAVNIIDTDNGNTPLHYVHTGTLARMLLEKGADPTMKNLEGKTPLDIAKDLDLHEVAEVLKSSIPT
jgi:ankyrin repeat protein